MSRRTASSSLALPALPVFPEGFCGRATGVREARLDDLPSSRPVPRVGGRRSRSGSVGLDDQIWRIEIILAGNPDQREQGIAPGIGQYRAHPVRLFGLGYPADRPIGGDPFPRRMRDDRSQFDDASGLINRGGLQAISC